MKDDPAVYRISLRQSRGLKRTLLGDAEDVPNGLHVLMVRHRQEGQVA